MADAHKNFAVSAVATAPSPATSGTSLVVTAGHGTRFPAVPFNATIWPTASQPTPANAEVVRVTAISTDTLTITRAQEGSSVRTVVVGDQIAATITAKTLTDAENSVTTDSIWDAKGDLVVASAADTAARLAAGANGTVLRADSNATPGLAWVQPLTPYANWIPASGKIEVAPRYQFTSGVGGPTSGVLYLFALPYPLLAGVTYTSITFISGSGAAGTPTNYWFTLVRKSDLKTIRSTGDALTAAWGADTIKTLNLSSTYTPTADVDVYLGIMIKATTPNTFRLMVGTPTPTSFAPRLYGTSDTGLTVPLADETTVAALTNVTTAFYGLVS